MRYRFPRCHLWLLLLLLAVGLFGTSLILLKRDNDTRFSPDASDRIWRGETLNDDTVRADVDVGATQTCPASFTQREAVEDRCHVSDLHATILHLMGIDHKRLTYFYQGLDQRLTGVRGNAIEAVLA
jgi:hypothetical protein